MIFRNLLSKIFPWIQPKGSVSVKLKSVVSTTEPTVTHPNYLSGKGKKKRGRPKKK